MVAEGGGSLLLNVIWAISKWEEAYHLSWDIGSEDPNLKVKEARLPEGKGPSLSAPTAMLFSSLTEELHGLRALGKQPGWE